jgi:hypothetical protein
LEGQEPGFRGQGFAMGFLDYWNTFGKHDSLFHKSGVLERPPGLGPYKSSNFSPLHVPKLLEFALSR